jgi:hypothetical protein
MLEHVPSCDIMAAAEPGLTPDVHAAGGVRPTR